MLQWIIKVHMRDVEIPGRGTANSKTTRKTS